MRKLLTTEQASQIKERHKNGEGIPALAKEYMPYKPLQQSARILRLLIHGHTYKRRLKPLNK